MFMYYIPPCQEFLTLQLYILDITENGNFYTSTIIQLNCIHQILCVKLSGTVYNLCFFQLHNYSLKLHVPFTISTTEIRHLKNCRFLMYDVSDNALPSFLSLYMQSFPDNFIRREILSLKVTCKYKDDGCHWQGQLKSIDVSGI